MNDIDLDSILKKTLDDKSLSRNEKRALKAVLEELDLEESDWGRLQSRVFDMAREKFSKQADREVVEWIEEVIKVFRSVAGPGPEVVKSAAYFAPEDDCAARVRELLANARNKADLCVFTITDNSIARAIIDAHKRGVELRVITDDDKVFDPGSDVQFIAEAGVLVRIDQSEAHMHHKFAVFDGRVVLTGSYNWTRSAAERNQENVVVTDDPKLAREFSVAFEKLWDQFG